jgi:hypothetical protein
MVHKGIEYNVKYRNIRYPRLEFKTGTLNLILPFDESPMEIIEKHSNWINEKQKFIIECLKDSKNKKISKRADNEFKDLINIFCKRLSKKSGVSINKIYFRKMRTKWASCSSKRNLTINTLMKNLPENLIEYIIYHELTHLIEKKHNDRFWRLISRKFKNYQKLETSLFHYWFLLNSLERTKSHAQMEGL